PGAVRALPRVQRLLRGSDHVARARGRSGVPRAAPARARAGGAAGRRAAARGHPGSMRRVSSRGAWAVLATLAVLIAVVVPELGADPWPFHPPSVHPHDVLGPVVRAASRRWDLGFVRTPGI